MISQSSEQWQMSLDTFYGLTADEHRILGFPLQSDFECHVSTAGIVNRKGLSISWELKNQDGRFTAESLEFPLVNTSNGQVIVAREIAEAIATIDAFQSMQDADVSDQFRTLGFLQTLPNVVMPHDLQRKTFVVPDSIQIDPIVQADETVSLQMGIQSISQELNAAIGAQIDRKSKIARLPQQMASAFKTKDNDGNEVHVAFNPKAKEDLKKIGDFRSNPIPRKQFMQLLREDPSLGFDSDNIDMSQFSERVLRVGLFIPSPEVVFARSENNWFPIIQFRNQEGEIRHLRISNEAELEALKQAIDDAKAQGATVVEFEGELFTLQDILELYNICFRQLEQKELKPPQGQIIPIVDEDDPGEFEDDEEDDEDEPDPEFVPYEMAMRMFEPPPHLARGFELFPHQQVGVGWLQSLYKDSTNRGGLIADDMGLGKTIQVLSFIHWHRAQQQINQTDLPYLIVAPVALLENWREEASKFFPEGMEAVIVHGANARHLPAGYFSKDVLLVTNYETLTRNILKWATIDWAIVALDEAQQIKNPGTIKSQAARSLKSRFNIAMTGTPVENRLTDLWAIMDFVQPGFLGTSTEFTRNFVSKRKERETGEANTARLRRTIGHRMLRRLKESTLENMPDKHLHPEGWSGFNLHPWSLPLTDAQMSAIQDFQLQFERDCANPDVDGAAARLRAIEGFRRVADHPLVADKRLIPILESPLEELIAKSAKLQVAVDVIEQVRAANEKVIVFSGIRLSQQLLARIVSEKFGIDPNIINGETPITSGRTTTSRQSIIEEFSKKPGFDVLILSPLAAGVGLNITAANHVIHFTRHWNPAKEAQATDRAYRIGQKKPVHIYYPMSLSEAFQSFDSVLHLLLERKQKLASSTLTPTQDLTTKEFMGLLQPTARHE
jgi:hypothetical protein